MSIAPLAARAETAAPTESSKTENTATSAEGAATSAGESSPTENTATPEDSAATEKTATPAVVEYVIWEDSTDSWGPVADHAQGDNIPYRFTASMAQDLAEWDEYPYWIVIRPDAGLTYVEGSARVACLHANGTSDDVTDALQVGLEPDGSIVAGSQNIKAAVPSAVGTDKMVLTYAMNFNQKCYLGFQRGNQSYGHVEYGQREETGTSSLATGLIAPLFASRIPSVGSYALRAIGISGTHLTKSPELKVTAHTYLIKIHKQGKEKGNPLEGAQFALRDQNGLWFVQNEPWNASRAKATVVRTDSQGYAQFVGVDAEKYELVETSAPQGYLALSPVEVTLESNFNASSLRATSSSDASLQVDAKGGVLTVGLLDPSSRLSSPATGDRLFAPALPGVLVISVVVFLCGVGLRGGRLDTARTGAYGQSSIGTDERTSK